MKEKNLKIIILLLLSWYGAFCVGILLPKIFDVKPIGSSRQVLVAQSTQPHQVSVIDSPTSSWIDADHEVDSCLLVTTNEDVISQNPNSYSTIVNKSHKIPDGYKPSDLILLAKPDYPTTHNMYLRDEAASHLKLLINALHDAGYTSIIRSGWRSGSLQQQAFSKWAARLGYQKASGFAADVGHSEHQLGTAIDINIFNSQKKSDYSWIRSHAHEYGFVLSYPKDKSHITGYNYEPWHYRFVGIEMSMKVHERSITLTEHLYDLNGLCNIQ